MDSTIFLTIVIFVVSLTVVAVGVYLILLLVEARQSLKRINHILEHVETVTDQLENGFAAGTLGLINSLNQIKDIVGPFVGYFSKKKDHHSDSPKN